MTTPKRSPGAHDICIHPNDMHGHTCHSQTSEIDSADAAARGDSRPTGMYVLSHVSTQCFCSYVLMWETNTCGNLSKAVIGGTATLKVLVLPCPCLHQELLITCLPQHRELNQKPSTAMLVVVWIWLQFPWQRKNVTFGYVQQGRNMPYEVFPWAFMRCVCGKLAVLRAFPPPHLQASTETGLKMKAASSFCSFSSFACSILVNI